MDERGGRPVLLVVDDEVRVLSALQRTLRREGYEILTAETAADALRLLAETQVDVMLSDHKMPIMSGIELFAEATRLQPKLAKILITGWTEAVPPEELEAAGITALVPKPWDADELKQTLRDAVNTGGAPT